jgi:NAD(P)-dependent dehydrogenase (short-subunit alcohol dehydrogenase family)
MTAPVDASAIVVTGAGKGIGRAIAACLAARGRPVVAIDVDRTALDRLVDEVPGVDAVAGDVRDVETLQAASRTAADRGVLGGWVNNAGIVRLGPLHAVTSEDIDAVLGNNLAAVVLGCQVALQSFLRDRTHGGIVNISSIHARAAFPGYALYDTAKGGVEALTRYVCVEYGHLGIRCNAVAPGAVDTTIVPGSLAAGRDREADLEAARALSPMHRVSSPEEIAGIVAFLLSDAARSVNGQVIGADNGMSARAVQLPPDPCVGFA